MRVPRQPDAEAFVWSQIRDLPGVTSFSVAAVPMPLVPWLVAHTIQIDARANTKEAAADRAEQVRARLWRLASAPWEDGVVSYVQIVEGPFWSPDDDGAPHYVIRLEIRVHPVPGASEGAMLSAAGAGPIGGNQ